MAIAGKVAITLSTENGGAWSADVTYDRLVAVKHNNNLYISRKTVANVEPPNNEFWFLALEGFSGDDIEDIINGTTQVGNAKTLDGHEAEYFAPLTELVKYFKNTGGAINGNVKVYTPDDTYRVFTLENGTRTLEFALYAGGAFRIYDITNNKVILLSTVNGTNTIDATASGNLPLDGGTLRRTARRILTLDNIHESASGSAIGFSANGTFLGEVGVTTSGNLVFNNSVVEYALLHTGNKPTGTYTGNGDATARTIATGGIGNAALIYRSGEMYIVTASGVLKVNSSGVSFGTSASFVGGTLKISSANEMNASGNNYTYQVL